MFKRALIAAAGSVVLFVSVASAQVTTTDPTITVTLLKSGLSGPAGLAFRPLSVPQPTHDLVVSQEGANAVSLVDAITGATTSYVSQSAPGFLAVRASDDLVAVTPQPSTADVVNFYDSAGNIKGSIPGGFAGPGTACLLGVVFDSAGNFYVATGTSTNVPPTSPCPSQVSFGSSSIYEFAGATPWSATGSLIVSGLDALAGLAFSPLGGPSGSLFAVSNADGNVYQEVLGGTPTTTPLATDPSGNAGDPTGITVDTVRANVLITEFAAGTVRKLHLADLSFSTVVTGLTNPFGLGFDSGGNGYVADFGTGDIWKFSLPGPVPGDVVVAVGNAQYNVYHNVGSASAPNYVLADVINDGTGGFYTTGCGFDSGSNLLTTNFTAAKVLKFDANAHIPVQTIDTSAQDPTGNPESLLSDSSGNLYVGNATNIEFESPVALLLKYGPTGTFVTSFTPADESRGKDWIDMAADQQTVFYTSEGTHVKRFNVSTSTQLADFNGTALPGRAAYALRLLPPFDGTGGLLVADTDAIRRLDGSGNILAQTYTAACTEVDPCPEGGRVWFALNLDPNGTSFWAGDIATGDVFRFNIASGAIEVGPVFTPGAVGGICVKGEPAPVNTVQLTFPVGTSTQKTIFGSGANASSWKANLTANTSFSITLTAHEVVCDTGIACNGDDFDGLNNYRCRWEEYFSSDPQLPIGIPYSNGNCVFYRVENPPPDSDIGSDIQFTIGYNDSTPGGFCSTLPAGFDNPRFFRDPSSPPPADASTNHSFAFDITQSFNPSGNVGDPTITGDTTKTLNDYAVACRATTGATATWLKPMPDTNPTFKAGSSINLEVRVTSPDGVPITDAVNSPNSMPLLITGPGGVSQILGTSPGFWTYDPTDNWYIATWKSLKTPTGLYTLCVSSTAFDYPAFPSTCTTLTLK